MSEFSIDRRFRNFRPMALPLAAAFATEDRRRGLRVKRLGVALLLAVGLAASGCTRTFWRGRADREVSYLVAEKSNNPRWALPPGFNLNIDSRSRYYDPTNPDQPPLPPDDPYSHVYMHYVDGKRAAPYWHRFGELPQLPNPGWRQRLSEYCDLTDDGAINLDLTGALSLSYIHSPIHRMQLETLYLSAIDVSTERFRFNTQLFANTSPVWAPGGDKSRSARTVVPKVGPPFKSHGSPLTNTTNFQATKEFATGGTLLVNFANSFVWQLAGPQTNNTNSLINFNLIQPLLQHGGRIITLEALTRVERTLLANLRAYQRWRQGWFNSVATGGNGAPGPTRIGGGTGGTGLTNFSGQGANGQGNIATAAGFGGSIGANTNQLGGGNQTAAVAGAAGGGAGTLQGFVGLLQQKQQLANATNALNLQSRTLKLLEANLEAGLISISQVDTFRQSIQTSLANVLGARISLELSTDQFLANQLGLPPDLPIVLDDSMLRQFQLVDAKLDDLQTSFSQLTEQIGNLRGDPTEEQLGQAIDEIARLRDEVGKSFEGVGTDLSAMEAKADVRMRRMSPAQRQDFRDKQQRLGERLRDMETRFEQSQATMDELRAAQGSETTGATADDLVAFATSLSGLAQEISLVKALARLEAITIEPVELSTVDALQIARAHRLDWMNQRAALVDSWRLIAFNANALRSNLTVTMNGDVGTIGNNPLRFQQATGDFSAGLRFDAPITRLLERNNYRQALITYQQARRALIQYEDATNVSLRQDMRSLVQYEQNLEIQREAVAIAIRRVDQSREALNEPPPAALPGQMPTAFGPTLATTLLTAVQALSDAQNAFMSVYLQYYNNRLQLFQDLGIMQLDERGVWIDEPLDKNLAAVEAMYPLPPEIPVDWLRDAKVDPNQAPALPPTDAWRDIKAKVGNVTNVTAERAAPVPQGEEGEIQGPNDEGQPADSSEPGEMPAPGDDGEARASKKRNWRQRFFSKT
ncbi:MAG TPA: hypothetical protein VMV69_23435 [Pirellulales bacterium]|nr:hypothetical protein [Pirellulales bacterium]